MPIIWLCMSMVIILFSKLQINAIIINSHLCIYSIIHLATTVNNLVSELYNKHESALIKYLIGFDVFT